MSTITVDLVDLRTVLQAVDYVSDRSLVGPVDRLSDAVALATMKLADTDEPCPFTISHTRHWCGNKHCRES